MSYQFDGQTSYIVIPSGSYGYFNRTGWTTAFWFKTIGTGTTAHQQHFIAKSGAGIVTSTVSLRINETNHIMTFLGRDENSNLSANVTYDPGTEAEWTASGWVHVVMTRSQSYDSDNVTSTTNDSLHYTKLYLNGIEAGNDTRTGAIDTNCNPIYLGRIGDSQANRTLSGNLAEFAKWDRVLTQTEITQLYRGHSPHFLSPAIYFPLRNDAIDHVIGLTGLVFSPTVAVADHPIGQNVYIQMDDKADIWNISNRVGTLEGKGFNDTVLWSPGQIASGATAQSGLFYSQARVGDAYVVAGNASLSGCVATSHVDVSGILTISVWNPSNILVGVQATSWRVYKL